MPGTVLYFPWFSYPRTVPVECWKQINEFQSRINWVRYALVYFLVLSHLFPVVSPPPRVQRPSCYLYSQPTLQNPLWTSTWIHFSFKSTNTVAYYVPSTVLSSGDPVVIVSSISIRNMCFSNICFSIGSDFCLELTELSTKYKMASTRRLKTNRLY